MLVEQMRNAVGEQKTDINIRIGFQKLHDDRQNVQAPENDGSGYHEIALWRTIFAQGGALGFADVFQDSFAGSDIRPPGVGQSQLTGRTDEELRLQMIFKIGDFAADIGKRHSQASARG
jgi:hypothetical protein